METRNSSRRKFIKSTGVLAGVTVIPSKSVWGMCNASGVSGGSQALDDVCEFEHTLKGRSPGSWTKFLDVATSAPDNDNNADGRDSTGLTKIHGMFSLYSGGSWNWNSASGPYRQKLETIYDVINGVIVGTGGGTVIDLGGSATGPIPAATLNLLDAFNGNVSPDKHLACMYMNLYFGFIPVPAGYDVNTYMQHLWGVGNVQYSSLGDFGDDLDSYNDSATSTYNFGV